jgi:hypothetical protein
VCVRLDGCERGGGVLCHNAKGGRTCVCMCVCVCAWMGVKEGRGCCVKMRKGGQAHNAAGSCCHPHIIAVGVEAVQDVCWQWRAVQLLAACCCQGAVQARRISTHV